MEPPKPPPNLLGFHLCCLLSLSPSCVGLRYGRQYISPNEAFLGTWGQRLWTSVEALDFSFSLMLNGFACPTAYTD